MLELKNYQQRSLDDLERFFKRSIQVGATHAFIEQTSRPYKSVRHFPNLPYVCLRVPTGGGKTLMAAHAVGIAAREYLQAERAVCLWLVPSNAIREQTLAGLKDRSHPFRQALASRFAAPVSVLNLAEALYVQPGTLAGEAVVIVATLAAFRVEETEGRKVYESAGALMDHFTQLTDAQKELLEREDDGTLPYSLANVLRLHRPIVIMDEAHNARTPLSFDTLARFNPSCIIEFTATPERIDNPEEGKFASNVLCHVSAKELKVEQMLKLPIRLELQPDWQKTVSAALGQRVQLEEIAKREREETGEYIRPIVLLQAQARSRTRETVTVDKLKQHLIEDCRVTSDEIKIATGSDWELDGVNLLAETCPVRFIITVNALREGWDCAFAYVLCSVSKVAAATAVEQVLGRVLRMPKAKSKRHDELNRAYAFVSSADVNETIQSLRDALVDNGFEEMEAGSLIVHTVQPETPIFTDDQLFGETTQPVSEAPRLDELSEVLRDRVRYDAEQQTITVTGRLTPDDVKELEAAFPSRSGQVVARRLFAASGGRSVAVTTDRSFRVPLLSLRRPNGVVELFEDQFQEVPWNLMDHEPLLTESEFPTEPEAGQVLKIDVSDRGKLEVQFAEHLRRQVGLFAREPGWDLTALANWLDRSFPHPDILPGVSKLFILRLLERLQVARSLTAEKLARRKYALRDALQAKFAEIRRAQHLVAYQRVLFDSGNALVLDEPGYTFEFKEETYAPNWYYEGGYRFQKHICLPVGELKSDGEEFECAQFIDMMPEVKWWVRNLERGPQFSFWLQTPTDRFYPDFVAFLHDGRRLCVEYKGFDRWSNDDSKEKRDLGDLWASASNGSCIFVMPKGPDWQVIRTAIEG